MVTPLTFHSIAGSGNKTNITSIGEDTMNTEPLYRCEYCTVYMVTEDVKYIVEHGNLSPKHFCSMGCYYDWANDIQGYPAMSPDSAV